MQRPIKKLLAGALAAISVAAFAIPASAKVIIYNGTGSGGGGSGGGGTLANASYSVPYTNMDRLFVGFRFSIYDGNGNKKQIKNITTSTDSLTVDVFVKENKVNGRYYSGLVLPCSDAGVPTVSAQLSKKEWLTTYYRSDVTPVPNGVGRNSRQNANCGFETLLPAEVCKEVLA